jgi:hypothetical protein
MLTRLLAEQNFALNVYAAQIATLPDLDGAPATYSFLSQLDLVFVLFFTAELAVNLYAHWLRPFLRNPWSIFDLLIVGLSLVGLAPIGLPLSLLLLFRCARVLRVFGRFKAASGIFSALAKSSIPMASTFFIIFVLSSICELAAGRLSSLCQTPWRIIVIIGIISGYFHHHHHHPALAIAFTRLPAREGEEEGRRSDTCRPPERETNIIFS